jgi:hypothetical protein
MNLRRVELQDGTTCYTAAPPWVAVPVNFRREWKALAMMALVLIVLVLLQLSLPVGV